MKFKKILLSVFCITSFLFGAEKSIIIGATPTPYAEILNFAKPIFKERGWNLEV
ncbi:methionine ABC transporter substrate-binding protein, partial [Campylobacter coli]|nr:methionine ABC transporter substrate-binding protein [Campylobacter coli]ECH4995548.1 methionine ABC transporter substrate-binding protein [Campylobacter coli]EIB8546851.1 methionine ABC transporter substrate-binding protein [Campylobacter coli]EJV0449540.1 methionine ABC transporter substrate-binding protein [Campylobacter coli]EJX6141455.1 methionine ABC transporter substrate-binding protein [Campylobacter coli]